MERNSSYLVSAIACARRSAHERLELQLHGEIAGERHRGRGHPGAADRRRFHPSGRAALIFSFPSPSGEGRRAALRRAGVGWISPPAGLRPATSPSGRYYTASSAPSRSSTTSSGCSRPAENRTRESLIPSSARSCGFRRWCVVVAGWVIRLLASPRLLVMATSLSALRNRNVAAWSPLTSKATKVEPPRLCFAATAACG